MTAVSCEGVSKRYGDVVALSNFTIDLLESRILALVGPSGCGKSTALRLIAGFERPDSGTIMLGGIAVASAEKGVVRHRKGFVPPQDRKVGMIFQENTLFPHMTIRDNVAYGLSNGRTRECVDEMLELVGLSGLADRYPYQLSGGQQQRVAVARSLAPDPVVLLLDEPFSSLDAPLRVQLREELREILKFRKVTAIFVTHDEKEALFMGDDVAILRNGAIEQCGGPEEVFQRPRSPFVARFLGMADFLAAKRGDGNLLTELGSFSPPRDVAEKGKIEIMVRPDDVAIDSNEKGGAVITDKKFRGMHYLYTVRLPSGQELKSLQLHYKNYHVGDHVSIRIAADHALNYFVDGDLAAGQVEAR